MVCKNCGADLKPGIKYCLECGNYIDDDDDSFDVTSDSSNEMSGFGGYQLRTVSKKKKKKTSVRFVDLIIYAGLALIIFVSLIVIVVTLIRGQTSQPTPTPTVVQPDSTVNIDDYQIVIPGTLNYDVQGSTLTVSDNQNYTFSYKNTTEDYDEFFTDTNALAEELVANNYEVLSMNRKNVANHIFIVGELRINGRVKYLYLTQVNQDYTTVGVIDAYDGGMWDLALNAIAEINDSIKIDGVYSNTYSNNTDPYNNSTYESNSNYSTNYETEQSNNMNNYNNNNTNNYNNTNTNNYNNTNTNNYTNTNTNNYSQNQQQYQQNQ